MKAYVKPELYYEDFQLSQHVAGNCTFFSNGAPNTNAGTPAANVMFNDRSTCTVLVTDDSEIGGSYCYTTSTPYTSVLTNS